MPRRGRDVNDLDLPVRVGLGCARSHSEDAETGDQSL